MISSYSFSTSNASAKQPATSSVGNIQNTEKSGEVGCQLHRKGNKGNKGNKGLVFWSGVDKSALMNIDGQDRAFKFLSETPVETQVEKKGDRSTVIYKSGKIILRIDRVATRVCGSGDIDCTGTDYDAKINLSVGNRKQVISATGYCGC
jgi:hypothetical protein